jgi:signal transduction histidine kinase
LFFNLINNAIKYNHEGGHINITGTAGHDNFMISITDNGIGIDASAMPFIFNRFKKFRQSLQQDSFGLGLPIVKSIAEFHDIEIEVVSEKDTGSTFKLIFPATLVVVS